MYVLVMDGHEHTDWFIGWSHTGVCTGSLNSHVYTGSLDAHACTGSIGWFVCTGSLNGTGSLHMHCWRKVLGKSLLFMNMASICPYEKPSCHAKFLVATFIGQLHSKQLADDINLLTAV